MLSYNFFHSILSFAKWDISINVCRFFDFEIYQQSHDCKIGNFTFYEGYYSAYLEQNLYLVHILFSWQLLHNDFIHSCTLV